MAKLNRIAGATSQIFQVFIQDSTSTTGAGKTGLTGASVVAYYHKDIDTTATAMSLTTMTIGTYTSLGFGEIDSTHMPGCYQVCPPTAALSTGSSVIIMITGTGVVPVVLEIDLQSQVDLRQILGTAVSTPATAGILDVNIKNINNVVAATPGAAGGLFISGTNTTTTVNFTGNLSGSVGSVTGNVGGSVGSVIGAVGSVTGNVGGSVGSVVGSVGSVVGAVGSVTGNVGGSVGSVVGNVGGSVGSVVGNVGGSVGSVVGSVGSVTGNLGGSVGSVTGNVVGSVGSVVGAVGSVTGNVGGSVGSVTAGVAVAATGLNSMLTDVTGDADMRSSGFKMLRGLFNRDYDNVQCTATAMTVRDDAGTVVSTMALSDDGTTITKGLSS